MNNYRPLLPTYLGEIAFGAKKAGKSKDVW